MTTKSDNRRKDEAGSAKRPKLKKQKLSDLDAKNKGAGVQGGFRSWGCQV